MKKWEILTKQPFDTSEISIEDIIQVLLANRGQDDKAAVEHFLHPDLKDITPVSVGIDDEQLRKALQRIKKGIDAKEKIIVYGDYDVDGITGTAILWETIHDLKGNVFPYIPHRVEEGYGLSVKGITNLLTQHPDTKLIITVDNGIVANEAVAFANERNLEVIVTDHHVSAGEEKTVLPKALAIVHTTKLCGAGVAWVLSKAMRKAYGSELSDDPHLELAALGTVADLVPLTGANRAIVKFGLEKLRTTKRKGLVSLFEEADIDQQALGVYQIGHVIGPRLNATGRMESGMDSLRLLCTRDTIRARELAHLLGKTNRERQQVMFEATEHASLSVKKRESLKKLLFVSDETYPEGVIGLIAGRLVEEYYRPAIVVSRGKNTSKGSVRSVNGFNIIEFLRQSSEYFVNVGGHPMAAGFTVETEKLDKLQELLEEMAEKLVGEDVLVRSVKVDMELPFSQISQRLYRQLQDLGPFGMGNPEPTFVTNNVEVKELRLLGKESTHLKLLLQHDFGPILEAIAFGMGSYFSELSRGDLIAIVYTIDENTWQGQTKLQLKIKDIRK